MAQCGCGEASYSGEGTENWWFVHGWGVHGMGRPLFCPRCADRLNADGTVTPTHEWIAEELALRQQICESRSHAAVMRFRAYYAADNGYLMAANALRMNLGAEDPAAERWESA
jgi:hypothetical protein